jgi:hypothetical protein
VLHLYQDYKSDPPSRLRVAYPLSDNSVYRLALMVRLALVTQSSLVGRACNRRAIGKFVPLEDGSG